MTVFADILFAVNFIMDILALFVCGKILNFKIHKLRLFLSAALGGVYGILGLFVPLPEPFCAIMISVIMCLAAFGKKSVVSFVKTLILFYAVSMLFGGIMTFLYDTVLKYRNAPIFDNGLKLWMFAALTVVMFVFTLISGKLFGMYIHKKSTYALISFGDFTKEVHLLWDSGNLLRDPYSGQSVIIIKAECLDEYFGKDGLHRNPISSDNEAVKYKFRYIPVKTAAGNSLLPAFSADSIKIKKASGKYTEIPAILACDSITANSYGEYDGIIPYSLIQNH